MSTVDSHVITAALYIGLVMVQSLRMILGHSAVAKTVLQSSMFMPFFCLCLDTNNESSYTTLVEQNPQSAA